jgi:hypothetical protein
MSLRADMYRQRAAEAKQSAARAKKERIRRSGGRLARTCQMEWIDRERERKTGPDEPS